MERQDGRKTEPNNEKHLRNIKIPLWSTCFIKENCSLLVFLLWSCSCFWWVWKEKCFYFSIFSYVSHWLGIMLMSLPVENTSYRIDSTFQLLPWLLSFTAILLQGFFNTLNTCLHCPYLLKQNIYPKSNVKYLKGFTTAKLKTPKWPTQSCVVWLLSTPLVVFHITFPLVLNV